MEHEQINDIVYTIAELSQKLKVSRSTAYSLARTKDFPKICIGKRILIPESKLKIWLERQCNV